MNNNIITLSKTIRKENLALEFCSSSDWNDLLGASDIFNVQNLVLLLKEAGLESFLVGDVAYNHLFNTRPKGKPNTVDYVVPYSQISLAAMGPNYEILSKNIVGLINENTAPTEEAIKRFGEDFIIAHPTVREPLGGVAPNRSYRFGWKDNFADELANCRPRQIVLGIYDSRIMK